MADGRRRERLAPGSIRPHPNSIAMRRYAPIPMKSTPTMRRIQYSSLSAAFIALPTLATPVTMISENAITGRAVATAKTAGTPSGSEVRSASGTSIAKKSTAENGQKVSAKSTPRMKLPASPRSATRSLNAANFLLPP